MTLIDRLRDIEMAEGVARIAAGEDVSSPNELQITIAEAADALAAAGRLLFAWSFVDSEEAAVACAKETEAFLVKLLPEEDLCEDEGCPHHGTPHVCVPKAPAP